jgi:hypothetical protein
VNDVVTAGVLELLPEAIARDAVAEDVEHDLAVGHDLVVEELAQALALEARGERASAGSLDEDAEDTEWIAGLAREGRSDVGSSVRDGGRGVRHLATIRPRECGDSRPRFRECHQAVRLPMVLQRHVAR